MTFRVIITDAAEDDADAIYLWLQERSPRGAVNWWAAFLRAVDSLRRNAQSFGLAIESADQPEDIREFTFSTRHGNPYRLVLSCVTTSFTYCESGAPANRYYLAMK